MDISALHQHVANCGLPPAPTPMASRRSILSGLISGALLASAGIAEARAKSSSNATTPQVDPDFWKRPRSLWLKRQETGEAAKVIYWSNGSYHPEAYVKLCGVTRDVRASEAVQMDVSLLNVLAGIQAYYRAYSVDGPIIITSGFRTMATNQKLSSEGAAKNSMHLYGRAVDLTIPGVPVSHLGQVRRYLGDGGLGFYSSKGFIHLDTGNTRTWRG